MNLLLDSKGASPLNSSYRLNGTGMAREECTPPTHPARNPAFLVRFWNNYTREMFREVVCGQILGEFPAQKFRDFSRIFGILVMSPTRRSCHQLGGHVVIPALTHPFPRTLGTLYVASERFFSLPPPETMFPRRKTYQTLITCLPGLARKSRVCQNGFFPRKWGKVAMSAV